MYYHWALAFASVEQQHADMTRSSTFNKDNAIYIPDFPSTNRGISSGILRGGKRAQLAPGPRCGQSFFHRVGHELGETLRLE